jgi:hypothetical protein
MDVVSVSAERLDVAADSRGGSAPEGALVQAGTESAVRVEKLTRENKTSWRGRIY